MARDFEDSVEEFLAARMDAALQKLHEENQAHAARKNQHETLHRTIYEAIAAQPVQTQQMFKDFLEQYGILKDEESEFFYRAGMCDAMQFLRFFKVI